MFETLPIKTVRRIEQRLQQLAELAAIVPTSDYRWRNQFDAASGLLTFEVDGHRVLCAPAEDHLEVRRILSPPNPTPPRRFRWFRGEAPQPA